MNAKRTETVLERIRALPDERLREVEVCLDRLTAGPHREVTPRVASDAAESAFARVWDNADDAAYDSL